jgi:hypothetical protein
MIVAVVSESSADEAAVRRLLVPLIGVTSAQETQLAPLRTRGWGMLPKILPAIVKQIYYHTAVDALLVTIDSDDSSPHGDHAPDAPGDCRLCLISALLTVEISKLTPVPLRNRLKTAVGLCIPAIEAWYLCGVDPTVTEALWIAGRRAGKLPYTRGELKKRIYGSSLPILDVQLQKGIEHAGRLAADLDLLRTWFPSGCGTMLDAVGAWPTAS